MELQAVSYDWAQKIIAAGLHCDFNGDNEGLRISAISECLRSVSYMCSLPASEHDFWNPAASVRLTGMVRTKLASIWPDLTVGDQSSSPTIMDVLNNLADLGDMNRFTGGKWLPAPIHAVTLSNGKALLLGGGPIRILPRTILTTVKVAGPVRIVKQDSCVGLMEFKSPNEWIGAPIEGLRKWSERLLARVESKFSDASRELNDSLVYFECKWIEIKELPLGFSGIHLCIMRLKDSGGYFIGEFTNSHLCKVSSIDVIEDARRFRFYSDMQANRSINVHFSTSQGLIKFKLKRRLPNKEAKILCLGWQMPSPNLEHPGIAYHVLPEEMLPIVQCAFDGLGIKFVERNDARSKN